ncbi:tRNA dihydrouridine synthase DusB [Rhizobium sp. KVB221]|uniref:tRNA-dihydrouridine synthase n=1 Tax=Rhizobium setariae TaxID=2801340 RepID=A0A937CM53_9HYPH|nr:tRNA dihydrouridine synthase DusB [Rhizobium setariae]MBL0373910.1 tRNA dihydrouridine synthase DusB [Rhizobium setariae]
MTTRCLKDEHLKLDFVKSPLQVGSVKFRNRIALAPMSGVTDLPFRQLAFEFGAGFVVTEMVASRELVGNSSESWSRLQNSGIDPHIVQLAGRDPHYMAEGARIAEANGADMIDINMGCPAKKVIGGLSGSALMREPELALSLIDAVVKAVSVPVTVKMRLGWDEASINAPELAHAAEDLGAQMITIHGRTRMQFYEGRANWEMIARVRERISVPLIANGDVETPEDVALILEQSGADGVMVGRGSQGRPWHAGVLAGTRIAPDRAEIADIFERHYRMTLEFYGGLPGLRHARKHVGWALDRFGGHLQGEARTSILTSQDPESVIGAMRAILLNPPAPGAGLSEAA